MNEETNKKLNLYQKIANIMSDVQYLKKDDSIEYKTTRYKAISEEKVTSTIRVALMEQGIVIIPIEQEHFRTDTLTTVNVKYRIQNTDCPDDYIIAVSSGTGVDTQDKGVGKAMTYAYKYLLLRTFAIPTGEDPDKISSAELDDKKKAGKNINEEHATEEQLAIIRDFFKDDEETLEKTLEHYKVTGLVMLKKIQASAIIDRINAKQR